MDAEIRKALANIKARQRKIEREHGKQEDDGPLFGRRHGERRQRLETEHIEELFDDLYDE